MGRPGFVDGVLVNGVDIIKWNDGGQIVEFKVMLGHGGPSMSFISEWPRCPNLASRRHDL
jgi:hypothetical protein